ncbi:Globin family and Globin-like domain and Globin, structural domain-containing protein [Strongyloides ratti]|uniref:Globin family and Globin-like domain and Globin, structural domain-containing protein n=1 Tax=Strongyloides ratti TaxID=34506 RepID=A0A090LNZ5_STRRB|nr:Globin family and Globin-like domain and Globin, structural domain-containing protein [Strongyloides ratti]CEF71580.1 Globin family and Globin-like domain and Globin, structural domain-containing protein [Strongyloides ratti]
MYRVMICENNSFSTAVKRELLSKSVSQNSNYYNMNKKNNYNSNNNSTKDINVLKKVNNGSFTQSVDSAISIDDGKVKSSDEGTKRSDECFLNACDNDKNLKIKKEVSRLTKKQQIVLEKTFSSIKDRAVPNGIKVLLRMFAEHPQYKDIWPQFRPYPDSSLMCAPEISRHAKIYMKGLEYIISTLNDEEKLCKSLQQIARAHTKWNIHKKHVMHMLEQVLIMLADEIGSLTNEEKEAWTTLYDVIANMVDILAGRV